MALLPRGSVGDASAQPDLILPPPQVYRVTSTLLPEPTPTPTPTPTAPEPTQTPTELVISPTPLVFPDYDPIPQWQIDNVTRWTYLVEYWLPDYDVLDIPLVLAVMGQESKGYPSHLSDGFGPSGGVGLMQVVPRPWTATQEQLYNPSLNVNIGMWILDSAIRQAGDVYTGLAAYNCGFESLYAGKCYSFGGYAYSEKVLYWWLPNILNDLGLPWVEYERLDIPLNHPDYGKPPPPPPPPPPPEVAEPRTKPYLYR